MNMYMMNLLNGVEALTTDLNLIEKEVQNNDDVKDSQRCLVTILLE